mgnify:CR=1 FL=1
MPARKRDNAEIDNVRFHDLRHTFASYLVMNGVDLRTVQTVLGHQSLAMTERYAHLSQNHVTRAIQNLDKAFQTDTITAHQPVQASATLVTPRK